MVATATNPVVKANAIEDIQAAVHDAASSGVPLIDYGLAHRWLGNPPPDAFTRLQLAGGVIEHHAEAHTVRVHAGCHIGELHRRLSAARQFLAIDADDDLTVGEVIAHDVCGALTISCGRVCELLHGITYVDGTGAVTQVDGATQFNNRDSDPRRFMTGSLNELAVIHEAVFQTHDAPMGTVGIDMKVHDPQLLDPVLDEWLGADARPAWLMLTKENHNFVARLAYFGSVADCMRRLRSLETLIQRWPGFSISGTGEDTFHRDRLRRATRGSWKRIVPALVQVIVPRDQTGFICHTLAQQPFGDPSRQIEAHPVNGCIFIGGPLSPDAARRLDQQVSHVIQPVGGRCIWHRRPVGADDIASIHPLPADYDAMVARKAAMDPHGLLNPNRFLPVP